MERPILFDATALDCPVQSSRGIGRYVKALSAALQRIRPPGFQAMRLSKQGSPALTPRFSENGADWRKALSRTGQLQAILESFDGIYHSNELGNLPPSGVRATTIATIYDIIPMEYPDQYLQRFPPFRRWFWTHYVPRRIRGLDRIVTMSATVRDNLLDRFNLPEESIVVIPPGIDHLPSGIEADSEPIDTPPFFLYVGGSDYRKNLSTLLDAFAVVAAARADILLVLVGQHGNKALAELDTSISRLNLAGRVVLPGYVDDIRLQKLTRSAIATVVPSLSEGFGLPVLESMDQGCPVVASDIPVFREIAKGGALLVDPHSAESIADGMLRILDDSALARQLVECGHQIASRYRWDTSAHEHAELYAKLNAERIT